MTPSPLEGRESAADDASLRLEPDDVFEDDSSDSVLDLGYSPEQRPWVVDGWGVTAREQSLGEDLDGRLAREVPEERDEDDSDDGLGDIVGTDGELRDSEVGDQRAGRLLDEDQDDFLDTESELLAWDQGVDGGGASAEEAAMHVIPDE